MTKKEINKRPDPGMIGPDRLTNELENRRNELMNALDQLKQSNHNAPKGYLRVAAKNGHPQYYQRMDKLDKKGRYITKSNHKLAAALAQKDYCERMEKAIQSELLLLDRMLKDYDPKKTELIYTQMHPDRRALIHPVCLPDDQYAEYWQNEKYCGKTFNPQDTTDYYTARGERVRSKSEILIADALYRKGVPYRYEYPIQVHYTEAGHNYESVFYPDFYCLNKRMRIVYIWEHMGMMGDPDYANLNIRKMEIYERNGYFPGDNMILTMESIDSPISTRTINRTIEKYLI